MHKKLLTWQLIQQSLQQHIEVMLLYVLESKGSSPGRQGFFMAVTAAGELSGSMGGGIMEHKFIELAKAQLKKNIAESSVHLQLHDKKAASNQSGMICSGEQTIFLYTVKQSDATAIDVLIESLQTSVTGTLQLSPAGIEFHQSKIDRNVFEKINDHDFVYKEKTGYSNNLVIIGGGHCALSLSQLMSNMDFFVHVFEERDNLHTLEQNYFAHAVTLVESYTELSDKIAGADNTFVVIMTQGYRTDMLALRSLLSRSFSYLGVLGSKAKIKKLFADFIEEGITHQALQHVHAPIGLPISSQTTEEIAISIAAEIISVKNKGL